MISPGLRLRGGADEREIFMSREEVREKFRSAAASFLTQYQPDDLADLSGISSTGERESDVHGLGQSHLQPAGWKGPCYLITDAHHETFKGFMDNTPWEKYGRGRDPRCEHCMVHAATNRRPCSAPTASWAIRWKMLKWNLTSPKAAPYHVSLNSLL